jgi:predicted permease
MNKKNQKYHKTTKPQTVIKKENNFGKLFSNDWFILLLLVIVTVIAYSNSFSVPFQFDDEQQIVLRQSNHSFQNFTHLSYWLNVNNRPVSTFTIVANYLLNGEKVAGYHVVNLIIHLLSGIILFFWLRLLTSVRKDHQISKWLPVVITSCSNTIGNLYYPTYDLPCRNVFSIIRFSLYKRQDRSYC